MSETIAVVVFILAILLVILIHEAAHFGFAKLFGIKVEEFFLGFGPRLWSTRRGETEYGVKALPLGGYVRIAGMNPFEEITPEEYPRTFGAKPVWQRAIVIFAGPATHFVIAFLLFVSFLLVVGSAAHPQIAEVQPRLGKAPSPASQAGVLPGDRIVAIDDIDHPSTDQVIDYTQHHAGVPITLVVVRDGQRVTLRVTPQPAKVPGVKERVGRIGVTLGPGKEGVGPAIADGAGAVGTTTVEVVKSLGRVFGPQGIGRIWDLLFTSAPRQPTDVTSGVGLGRAVGQAAGAGNWGAILLILASVNVFVGILNLVPLPPFDGGHLAVLAVEKIRRRKVDMRKLVPVTAVVAAFLVLFMVSVLYLDIVKPLPDFFR
jgi:membrane-associated protease RseP (regulator of RpoE activity)